ncbi:dihydrofolate reductase [Fusibacter sp. JL216-2]|uniref:dihydrofolate reductase n=1 Tax=Fusibacter sp. JL216-2 TaxID=3071453 RepID=UPI003D34F0B2
MINMIVAIGKNREIGKGNELLAHIPEDLKYFKKKTAGGIVIMGYNTYESLPSGALPKRENIVITRKDIEIPKAHVVGSIEEAVNKAKALRKEEEVFVIGGASIYEQFLPHASKLYITHIFEDFHDADTFFPKFEHEWKLESIDGGAENIGHDYPHVFAVYERAQV